MSVRTRLTRAAVLLSWALVITYWSNQTVLPIDHPTVRLLLLNNEHRIAHLVAFGMLGLLAAWSFEGTRRAALLALVFTSVFGALDEFHQSFVPGRHAGADDWLFDTFSAALALFVWPRLQLRRPRLAALNPLLVSAIFAVAVLFLLSPRLLDLVRQIGSSN